MFSVHYYDWTSTWKSGHKSSDTGNISGESLGEIRRKKRCSSFSGCCFNEVREEIQTELVATHIAVEFRWGTYPMLTSSTFFFFFFPVGGIGEKINVMRSIHNLGAIMTRMALGGNQDPWGLTQQPEGGPKPETEIDHVVMETKAKIIEILEFIMNVRLDYRISSLLTIFKKDFDESNAGLADMGGENGTTFFCRL